MKHSFIVMMLVLVAFSFLGCGSGVEVPATVNLSGELANQMGDVMASIDEAGAGGQSIAITPMAACGLAQVGSCTYNSGLGLYQKTRNFNSCTIGDYTLTGTNTITWTGGTNCALSAPTQSIRISPNYTVASDNFSLTTTKIGTHGITLTWASGSGTTKVFNYTNDGVNRTLTSAGQSLLDINTSVTTPLVVRGTSRGSRTVDNGGQVLVVNNINGETCTFTTANNMKWDLTTCNCATSGSWIGSCTTTGTIVMAINGCGLAEVTYTENSSTKTQSVNLDRCGTN